ncbi:acyltransferase [Piromyces finnis]|uniref:Acyltransferase n=1 Tax=Piromyces finnis TaxID=1754191 RepID=A0A1Y1V7H6_9FUNG|nr:acyltransferase [Piromyces finnis]|eukprot:ORX48980.1 acyltransferase [Piromyces finnis]
MDDLIDDSIFELSTEEFCKKYDANSLDPSIRNSDVITKRLKGEAFRKLDYKEYPTYKKIGVILVCIFVLPLRLLSFFVFFILCTIPVIVNEYIEDTKGNCIENKDSPYYQMSYDEIPKSKKGAFIIKLCMSHFIKIALRLVFAFNSITINDKRIRDKNGKAETAPIIVSNHSSLMDILFITSYYDVVPSFVALEWIGNVPFIGSVAKAMQSVFVNPSKGKGITKKIQEHAELWENGNIPPVVIFPEGTTTNGKFLIEFKNGAFYPFKPIQPVLIHYKFKYFNPCWVELSALKYFSNLLTQWSNSVEITFLPVVRPTEEEKKDVTKYRDRLQEIMARELETISLNYSNRSQKLIYKDYINNITTFEECEKRYDELYSKSK